MSGGGLRFLHYQAATRPEPILARGPSDGPQILFIPPLFGEMNRTRRLIGDVMRGLEARGLGSWLPDLPGAGESLTPLETVGWRDWQAAVRAAAVLAAEAGPLIVASIRGGALLDDVGQAAGWWRLAPAAGANLVRELVRIRQMADAEEGAKLDTVTLMGRMAEETMELAGYRLTPAMTAGLNLAKPEPRSPLRTVHLGERTDPAGAQLAGPPLWRRAEPGASIDLAAAMAEDIAIWARTCAAS